MCLPEIQVQQFNHDSHLLFTKHHVWRRITFYESWHLCLCSSAV